MDNDDDDDDEHQRYGDSSILEPIVEQQDDEMITTSPMSPEGNDADFLEEERRAQQEIEQFEELEKEFASNRRGIRVKFDDERISNIAQTTLLKTEPYFHINSTEDQVTKHFYQNETKPFVRQTSLKTPSEPDSLEEEEEYIVTFKQGDSLSSKANNFDREVYQKITDQGSSSSFSPAKSILKKPARKETVSTSTIDRSSRSRSPSPSSSKKKQTSSTQSHLNELQHLAKQTALASTQSHSPHRSLFQPTINIFDPVNSNVARRPSRLRYYIKPYRGDTYIHPNLNNNQRSRSLSEQRLAQQQQPPSGPIVWHTFSNQYGRTANRKQHVSWSPVREYIHQGREKIVKPSPNKKDKNASSFPTRSSSSPCLQNASSMIPLSTRYRPSDASEVVHQPSSSPAHSLIFISHHDEMTFPSPVPEIVHPPKKEHTETLQRYDRLLEKMRSTDEQLQLLARSWTNKNQPGTSIKSNLSLDKTTTSRKELISPMILQLCLIILVIFNLVVVYFFNEINLFWNEYLSSSVLAQHQDEGTSNF